jgi:N-acetylglucosamine-6-sulfatase
MTRPNVLWIITDDQPRHLLGKMARVQTRLVDQGIRFARGYTAVPWCGPARASMLTGMYPHNHGCLDNGTLPDFKDVDNDTVATRMQAAGYRTGYFGKFINSNGTDPEYVAPGFDRYVTTIDEHDYDNLTWDPPAFNETSMADKPTWLHGIPMQDREKMRSYVEGMSEELQDTDEQVDMLLDALQETGQLADTFIFYVSDNGYLFGEHRLFKKEQPYEESSGIPFVVRGPGVAQGNVNYKLVSQVDLMPTTLDIAGLDPDAGRELDGRSMLAGLRGDWSGWRDRMLVENPYLGWAMLCEGSERFVDHYSKGQWECYDIATDPHQLTSKNGIDPAPRRAKLAPLRSGAGQALRAAE